MAEIKTINYLERFDHRWDNFHGNIWDLRYPNGYPEGTPRHKGWPTLTKIDTNYNYVVHGPTGGGKTGYSVYICICNAIIQGKPVYSNVPFEFSVYDIHRKKYKVINREFDIAKFIAGDPMYWGSWVLIDEGNFSMDVKKLMSNMNIGMTDIIQEGRKMGMNLVFTAISASWLDPRFTGSLLDIAVKCKDLYFTPYGREHELRKGIVTWWDFIDISGKYTGSQGFQFDSRAFFYRSIWDTFNSEFFINPIEARKRLIMKREKIVMDENGNEVKQSDWLGNIKDRLVKLAETNDYWSADDLWDTLGVDDKYQRVMVGIEMRKLGIIKRGGRKGDKYDLSELVGVGA